MFGSSLSPVVCRRAHVLFALFMFVCVYWCPTHIVLCFYFVFLRLLYPMFSVYLECPLLIAHSVFSNVYLRNRSYLLFASTWVYLRLVFFWRGPRCFIVSLPYCVFCCCFVCLYSVSCSQCCLRLSIVNIWPPLWFSLNFVLTFFLQNTIGRNERKNNSTKGELINIPLCCHAIKL